ncbi:MAG: glycosyltransferase [Ruminococcus sp.]|nr:glycosyltransferase [Ruminococcus sp.]
MKKTQYKYDVSVLVISYNPDRKKLISTLRSILYQKDVHMQIIVADDGSKNNYFDDIRALFEKHGFSDYVLVANEINLGITKNFYSGLVKAEGEFLKGISPGDYFYNENTLSDIYKYMKKRGLDAAFGNAVYFQMNNKTIRPVHKNIRRPNLNVIYDEKKYRYSVVKSNCWLLKDYTLGAAYFVKRELVLKYCEMILGKVKYMEDVLYRFMLLDDIPIVHYDKSIIMYEFGTGVSTTKESKWKRIMLEEEKVIEKLVIADKRNDKFRKKLKRYYSMNRDNLLTKNISLLLTSPGTQFWKICRILHVRLGKCYTETSYDKQFMSKIMEE